MCGGGGSVGGGKCYYVGREMEVCVMLMQTDSGCEYRGLPP